VRLDDDFVRAARFIEPSAADRARVGDARKPGRRQVLPVHRGFPGVFYRFVWFSRLGLRHRLRVVAALALALGMLSVGVLVFRQNTGRAEPATAGANPAAGPSIEVTATSSGRATDATAPAKALVGVVLSASAARATAPGDCLTWVPLSAGTVVTDEVACLELHRAKVTKIIKLADWSAAWPGQHEIDALAVQKCAAPLPGGFGVGHSAFVPRASSLHVAEKDWVGDARVLVCIIANQQGAPWADPPPAVSAAA
jgi:hypothetical protein